MILDIAIRNSSSLHTEVDNFDKNAITVYFFSYKCLWSVSITDTVQRQLILSTTPVTEKCYSE